MHLGPGRVVARVHDPVRAVPALEPQLPRLEPRAEPGQPVDRAGRAGRERRHHVRLAQPGPGRQRVGDVRRGACRRRPSAAASPPCASGVAPPTRSLVTTQHPQPAGRRGQRDRDPGRTGPDDDHVRLPPPPAPASHPSGLAAHRAPAGTGAGPTAIMASTARRARAATAGVDVHLGLPGAQAPLQRLGRDHLHVVAGRVRVDRLEADRGIGLAQLVQHPGLGRHEHRGRAAWCAPPSSIPPVDSTRVRSAGRSPVPVCHSAEVPQPHSGCTYSSASGRAAAMSRSACGEIPACTWHSPAQTRRFDRPVTRRTCAPRNWSGRNSTSRSAGIADDDLGRVRRGAADVGLGLDLGARVHVRDDRRAGVLGLPGPELLGGDAVGERAARAARPGSAPCARGRGSSPSRP